MFARANLWTQPNPSKPNSVLHAAWNTVDQMWLFSEYRSEAPAKTWNLTPFELRQPWVNEYPPLFSETLIEFATTFTSSFKLYIYIYNIPSEVIPISASSSVLSHQGRNKIENSEKRNAMNAATKTLSYQASSDGRWPLSTGCEVGILCVSTRAIDLCSFRAGQAQFREIRSKEMLLV